MIVDQVVSWAFSVVSFFVSILPPLPTVDCSPLSVLGQYTQWVGGYVDLVFIGGVLTTMLTVEAGVYVVRGIEWVWGKIPVIGGGF